MMKSRFLWPSLGILVMGILYFMSKNARDHFPTCRETIHIPSMGTVFEVQYVSACGHTISGGEIKHRLELWEASMSLYQPQSEIRQLNRDGILRNPSSDFVRLVN